MIRHWIGGAAANGSAPRTGPVYNPATGEQTGAVGFATAADVDKALQSARDALSGWRATSLSKRAELFFRIRELVRDHRDELARIVTR
jgi:malonate-semialdehyde dehydrogenase (acetylating)/methylmalonate-semialdehyde dehydrogenase